VEVLGEGNYRLVASARRRSQTMVEVLVTVDKRRWVPLIPITLVVAGDAASPKALRCAQHVEAAS
jgi:hypothetical protein